MEHLVSCYRCGARQTDPVRGASPWRRGVRADEQVLVCPDCQQNSSWLDDLDRCPVCGSTALFRRLGATVCRDCEASRLDQAAALGMVARVGTATRLGRDAKADPDPRSGDAASELRGVHVEHDLAREVAAAIDRVLGRA
jgi:predicted amidophosphoribosyltransferase